MTQQWEYCLLAVEMLLLTSGIYLYSSSGKTKIASANPLYQNYITELNKLGAEGWEAFNVGGATAPLYCLLRHPR
jgi:hypothetical protein